MPHFDAFAEEVPNFHEVICEIKRRLALTIDSKDSLELEPILLLGPPGIGKTHFAREIAELIGTGY
jgi:ATP-dependent Lon protease